MCGITGFFDLTKSSNKDKLVSIVSAMAGKLSHRGPDDCGTWVDEAAGVALGHRRLSIIDISAQGHQPMISGSGRLVIVFNGEIYNFQAIRKDLEERGYGFNGHSDTEIMLAAIEEWGVEGAVKRFIGMFAFALWDKKESALYLVRDRLGIKPLYYGWMGNVFLFGSELKAIKGHPAFSPEVDRDSLALYFRYNNIPAPYSIYKGICKVSPGTILSFDTKSRSKGLSETAYWSAKEIVEENKVNPFKEDFSGALNHLDSLLKDAVGLRMISDVPLGAFLSGGIDSSAVVALMQVQSSRPVKTFTIGFNEDSFNEAENAKDVAKYLGTEHTELYVTPQEAMSVISELPFIYDEPFADSSQIPTYLVSRLTRQHVKVSLSGDGGDELFAGYNRYFWAKEVWGKIGIFPRQVRGLVSKGITGLSYDNWERIFRGLSFMLPARMKCSEPGYKMQKLAEIMKVASCEEIYLWLVSHWKYPEQLVKNSCEQMTPAADIKGMPQSKSINFVEKMMFLDLVSYLPDDILAKVDRASMRVGLEARVPLLDHRVVEFSWKLPLSMKIRNGQGKWILRQVLYKYLPKELIERPKMGFAVPVDLWLRGPLRDWAESLLDYERIEKDGFLDAGLIKNKWVEHLSGRHNWKDHLWPVLMFQLWKESWL